MLLLLLLPFLLQTVTLTWAGDVPQRVPLSPNVSLTACEVVVYGTTPAGVAAAVAAAEHGAHACLLGPHQHVGGMASGGLGWDDVTPTAMEAAADLHDHQAALAAAYGTGLYTRFRSAVASHYASSGFCAHCHAKPAPLRACVGLCPMRCPALPCCAHLQCIVR